MGTKCTQFRKSRKSFCSVIQGLRLLCISSGRRQQQVHSKRGVFIHQTTRNDVSKDRNLGVNSSTGLGGRSKRIIDWAEINDHIKRLFYALCTNTARKCESDRPAGLQARYVPTVPSHFTTPKPNSLLLRPYLHDTC